MSKILRLGGKELRCIETLPIGVMFDLAEAMEAGEMAAVAGMSRTLRGIVVPDDRAALKAVLNNTETPVTFDELNTALGGVLSNVVGRPTTPRSSSPPGPAATAPRSKVVSLYRATGRAAATSTPDGTSVAS
jgi:hypothetical protein